jgi:2-(1,2-epoxy-1,2-dihydrophenyl)acetyl-CoA isomerase
MSSKVIALRESQLTIRDGVAEFVHQRPERRNPLSMDLRSDYAELVDRLEDDRGVRSLVITGTGGAFCAGGDLKSLGERLHSPDATARSPDAMSKRVLAAHGWFERLRNLPIPVIAAVDGPAVGAGMSLALAADVVLASTRAQFAMSFVRIGLVPDMAALYLLPRLVGLAVAKELVLTGRSVGPEEALSLGIVRAIHAPDALGQAAWQFARRFDAASAHALAQGKRLLNLSFETPYATMRDLEASAQAIAAATPEHAEALQRFLAGQPPQFDWDRSQP